MNALDKLRAWQPTAIDVRKAGKCPQCKQDSELFYCLPQYDKERLWVSSKGKTYISGGCYCWNCGFSNSCSMSIERYENAERLDKGADE